LKFSDPFLAKKKQTGNLAAEVPWNYRYIRKREFIENRRILKA